MSNERFKPENSGEGNLPGGPIYNRPVEMDGKFYDPLEGEQRIEDPETGESKILPGKEISKDEAYSQMFWQKQEAQVKHPEYREVEAKKEGMKYDLVNGLVKDGGVFSTFVNATQEDGKWVLDMDSKILLSAYRELAKEIGLTIVGSFQYDEKTKMVSAPIKRSKELG